MKKQTIAIIGVGMMGGSLGLALRKKKSLYRVIGVGRNASRLARAKKAGAVDEVTTDEAQGVSSADIVVICTPVSQIVPAVRRILPHLNSDAILTDIGSVKFPVVKRIEALFQSCSKSGVCFVGAHPMIGSEKTGVLNSKAGLYEGATVVLTPLEGADRAAAKVRALWKSAGARVIQMEPEMHDFLVAQTSHLPHVLAGVLVHMLRRSHAQNSDVGKILAGSFRDMSRISDSDPAQWADICAANHRFLTATVASYRNILNRILETLKSSEDRRGFWEAFFSAAQKGRAQLLSRRPAKNLE